MKTILLDQNDWISLAIAEHWPRKAEPLDRQLFEIVESLYAQGHQFPLSFARYVETAKTSKTRRRRDVAMTMRRFSQFKSLLHPRILIEQEIWSLLSHRFGTPPPMAMPAIGFGSAYAFGINGLSVQGPDDADPELVRELQVMIDALQPETGDLYEFWTLAGEPVDEEHEAQLEQFRSRVRALGQDFEVDEENSQQLAREFDGARMEEFARLTRAQTLSYFLSNFLRISVGHGLDHETNFEELFDREVSVLRELPTIDVLAELRCQKGANPARSWTANDYFDVVTLQHGVPNCDIVSADKHWAHLSNRAGLGERYETKILGRPRELIEALEEMVA